MSSVLSEVLALFGQLLRIIGFLVAGFALSRLVFDHFRLGDWRLQLAYVLGLFGLFIAVIAFSSPGAAGAFAIGLAIAYFLTMMPRKAETEPPATPREVA